MKNLAKKCDVLVENFVPGKLKKLGLDYDSLAPEAPQLIYCSVSGFGESGPYAQRAGYDVIAASIGGLMHITGPKVNSFFAELVLKRPPLEGYPIVIYIFG